MPVKFLFKGSNNMVSGDDSARKGTQLSLTEASDINTDLDMISFGGTKIALSCATKIACVNGPCNFVQLRRDKNCIE